jgi:hypothetical protein
MTEIVTDQDKLYLATVIDLVPAENASVLFGGAFRFRRRRSCVGSPCPARSSLLATAR